DACMAEPMRESANVADAVLVCPGQVIATQWVDAATDGDDVYRIYLEAGDTISLELAGEDGDADLYLYAPGTANVEVDPWAAFSNGDLSEERITYRVTSPGYWLIDVYAFDGAIAYVLRVEVTPGD
ncbi:MAG TPA: PPC domain-containing protein, partial [Caldilineaceae bacterium]|nr:PPC domain-containing protein [Caldilineaceae bacterium]